MTFRFLLIRRNFKKLIKKIYLQNTVREDNPIKDFIKSFCNNMNILIEITKILNS